MGPPQSGRHRPTRTDPTPCCTLHCGWLYRSREPGCVTNTPHKLDLPTLQDRRKQQRLSFFYKVVMGLVPAMPVEQFLKPLPTSKRQISPTKFQDFTARNIIDRQTTLNSRAVLVPHSNTEQHKNSFFPFFCPHHHRLEPPQWRPGEGLHAWGLQTTDGHQNHHLTHTRALQSHRINT